MSTKTSKVLDLFREGQANLAATGKAEEATKSGILRGGNSGLLLPDGRFAAQCPNLTWLRYQGVSSDNQAVGSRELMFEAGRTNEIAWKTVLEASSWPGKILCEEDVPVRWKTSSGVPVTGRPDMVLVDETGKNTVGIELKLVSAIWTARTVLLNAMPKLSHLAQVSHYSLKLGVPFELWYTNRTDFETKADFSLKAYPRYGEDLSEFFTYRFHENRVRPETGTVSKIPLTEAQYLTQRRTPDGKKKIEATPAKYKPFVAGYSVQFDRLGRVWYTAIGRTGAETTMSVVSGPAIEGFYEAVASLSHVQPEPVTLKANGKPEGYDLADYCSLGKLCCRYQEGIEASDWKEKVVEINKVLTPGK